MKFKSKPDKARGKKSINEIGNFLNINECDGRYISNSISYTTLLQKKLLNIIFEKFRNGKVYITILYRILIEAIYLVLFRVSKLGVWLYILCFSFYVFNGDGDNVDVPMQMIQLYLLVQMSLYLIQLDKNWSVTSLIW